MYSVKVMVAVLGSYQTGSLKMAALFIHSVSILENANHVVFGSNNIH